VLFEQYGGEGEEGWARLGGSRGSEGDPLAPAVGSASPLFAVASLVSVGKNTEKGKSPGTGGPGCPARCSLAPCSGVCTEGRVLLTFFRGTR